ncbi:hypothetical protein LIER_28125 [Lithospermum erythrorhizon]|uniref:Uncharacterized protein n=1 Tax=Lithospermum erythrorhizon TaxID=34254 RepID=A0AAV3RID6_LITER
MVLFRMVCDIRSRAGLTAGVGVLMFVEVTQTFVSRADADDAEDRLGNVDASIGRETSPVTLSIIPPSTSTSDSQNICHIITTSQSMEGSLASKNARKRGDIPTIIRDSLPVPFSEEDHRNFRRGQSGPKVFRGNHSSNTPTYSPSISTSAEALTSVLEKISSTAGVSQRPLFSKRKILIANKKIRASKVLDPSNILSSKNKSLGSNLGSFQSAALEEGSPGVLLVSLPDEALVIVEEGSDFALKAKAGYSGNYLDLPHTLPGGFQVDAKSKLWKNSEAFHATRPLLLDQSEKDFEEFRDPLEIHGTAMKDLIKCVDEALHAYQKFIDYALEVGKEAPYCLFRFSKSYKDVNPSIVANYEEFIQGYPKDWFVSLSINALLSPAEEEGEAEEETHQNTTEGDPPTSA